MACSPLFTLPDNTIPTSENRTLITQTATTKTAGMAGGEPALSAGSHTEAA